MMPIPESANQALELDVQRLKNEFANTQDLYREVCAVMFFRHGVTPTANGLYQLVRRGSMSAPAAALKTFWEQLREKSRVRMDHPDLPDALRDASAQLLVSMWQEARQHAEEGVQEQRRDAEAAVSQARAACAAELDKTTADAQRQVEQARRQTEAERARADEFANKLAATENERHMAAREHGVEAERLRQALAAETAALQQSRKTLDEVRQELAATLANAETVRADFSTQLAGFRSAMKTSEERHQALERRALLDLDQERTRNTRLAKLLEQAQSQAAEWLGNQEKAAQRHHDELARTQRQAVELEQIIAVARQEQYELRSQVLSLERQLLDSRDAIEAVPASETPTRRRTARNKASATAAQASNSPAPREKP